MSIARIRLPERAWEIAVALLERYGGDTFEALRERVEADRARGL